MAKYRRDNRNTKQEKKPFPPELYKKLLTISMEEVSSGGDGSSLVELNNIFTELEAYVKSRGKSITPTQLRNIYGQIKEIKISPKGLRDLTMLRPKLAYITARQSDNNAKEVTEFIGGLVKDVVSGEESLAVKEQKFKSFKVVMEAIVAYHKKYQKM